MKTVKVEIKPQAAFANGKRMVAEAINVVSISDNLFDHVVFRYTLFDKDGVWAGESTHELKGLEEYQTWDASAKGAYTIVIEALGLEVVNTQGKSFFGG
jgi:hypothetical protein